MRSEERHEATRLVTRLASPYLAREAVMKDTREANAEIVFSYGDGRCAAVTSLQPSFAAAFLRSSSNRT